MFVYERKCKPEFGFLILNRKSTDNLIQPIISDMDMRLHTPFLLYKTKVRLKMSRSELVQIFDNAPNINVKLISKPRLPSSNDYLQVVK